ncbi:hypothetical protein [Haloarcula halophila]|uniref:hypothetical protein n=1 Tax=Haloarcula TaxID=2237 RepID=UPI0023E3A338|nr:hypothetical protein [Halomicroarcula sp. DFY41]
MFVQIDRGAAVILGVALVLVGIIAVQPETIDGASRIIESGWETTTDQLTEVL